jgi:hypothetical protein
VTTSSDSDSSTNTISLLNLYCCVCFAVASCGSVRLCWCGVVWCGVVWCGVVCCVVLCCVRMGGQKSFEELTASKSILCLVANVKCCGSNLVHT